MKNKIFSLTMAFALGLATISIAQTSKDSTGLAGDNFDLYGVLDLFKQSASTEAFEKALNETDYGINNLDLNADGKVDYIKVVERGSGDDKVLILQDIIGENESHDVAVIEMEKKGNDIVHLQIVGDEALYGKNYIIEPKDEQTKIKDTKSSGQDVRSPVYVNVWGWPGVSWMYGPHYRAWGSPFYWGYYPTWWNPWVPVGWHVYYPRVRRYHYPYYHRVSVYHVPRAHEVYYGHRTMAPSVVNRNKTTVVHPREGDRNRVTQPHPKQRQTEVRQQKQLKQERKEIKRQPRQQVTPRERAPHKTVRGPRK